MTDDLNDFKSTCGLKLKTYSWPVESPVAVCVYIHGLHDHCGRYDEMAKSLNQHRFSVYAFDFIGHGKSEGKRAVWDDYEIVVNDIVKFVNMIKENNPWKDLFVIAKAVGVVLATHAINKLRESPAGFLAVSPAGKTSQVYSNTRKTVAKGLAKFLPNVSVAAIKTEYLFRDSNELQKYKNDPLVSHCGILASTASTILKAVKEAPIDALRLPLFVLGAEFEQVVDSDAASVLYQDAQATNKILKVYDSLFHDLFHEPEKQTIFDDCASWMTALVTLKASDEDVMTVHKTRFRQGEVTASVPAQLFLELPLFSETAAPSLSVRLVESEQFACPNDACVDSFSSGTDLLLHYRANHQKPPFKCCANCDQTFETAEDTSYHESLAHDRETLDRAARTHVANENLKK